jgi:hypothetical protein
MTPLLSDSSQASKRIRLQEPVIKGGIFLPNYTYVVVSSVVVARCSTAITEHYFAAPSWHLACRLLDVMG